MANGISIHIGLNSVDPAQYAGWDGKLAACEFDAKDMQALADKQGYKTTLLLTKDATSARVIEAISAAARDLKSGDQLLLTYSGHGGQLPDKNGDEPDDLDETWVLYDRQIVDDELYALWSKFKKGVSVLMLSDSCHSGTVAKNLAIGKAIQANRPRTAAN
ncbi:MAG TPA: caspase family protein, partial [Thermoflexales bacterium]|nr:caspase family protein [Thermoflexales bacterium]